METGKRDGSGQPRMRFICLLECGILRLWYGEGELRSKKEDRGWYLGSKAKRCFNSAVLGVLSIGPEATVGNRGEFRTSEFSGVLGISRLALRI